MQSWSARGSHSPPSCTALGFARRSNPPRQAKGPGPAPWPPASVGGRWVGLEAARSTPHTQTVPLRLPWLTGRPLVGIKSPPTPRGVCRAAMAAPAPARRQPRQPRRPCAAWPAGLLVSCQQGLLAGGLCSRGLGPGTAAWSGACVVARDVRCTRRRCPPVITRSLRFLPRLPLSPVHA